MIKIVIHLCTLMEVGLKEELFLKSQNYFSSGSPFILSFNSNKIGSRINVKISRRDLNLLLRDVTVNIRKFNIVAYSGSK